MDLVKAVINTKELMNHHGLIQKNWDVELNKGKKSLGLCDYQKKTIFLSKFFVELNDYLEQNAMKGEPKIKNFLSNSLPKTNNANYYVLFVSEYDIYSEE